MGETYDRWQQLMQASRELHDLLQSIAPAVRKVVNSLECAAEEIKMAAMDEKSDGDRPKKKNITYTGRIDATKPNIAEPVGAPITINANGRKRRTCGLCHEPGHWQSNCPKAHLFQEQKKAAVAAREVKPVKPKRTLTPERKAQLAKALVKARAARKKGA